MNVRISGVACKILLFVQNFVPILNLFPLKRITANAVRNSQIINSLKLDAA